MQAPTGLKAWTLDALPGAGAIAETEAAGIVAAEDWLRAQGCRRALGPLMGSTWGPYRAPVACSGRPPFLGEPPFEAEPWQAGGYKIAATWSSTLVPHATALARAGRVEPLLRTAGFTLVDLGSLGLDAGLPLLWRLSHRAFTQALAFSPLPLADFEALYRPLASLFVPELVILARSNTGQPVAFVFAIPDVLNPELGQVVVKSLAVDPAFHRLGLGGWLVGEAHRRAAELGLRGGGIHALMADGNPSQQIGGGQGRLLRRHALFEKAL